MSSEKFMDINFRGKSKELIVHCQVIIASYLKQNLKLTLRQLYYQLVSKNIIENKERSYKNLSSLVSDARLAGLLDWNAIEDRIRVPKVPLEFENVAELIDWANYWYRLPRWRGQERYAELWVEKDALAGVLQPIARQFHATLMVNRGYSSQSAMYEAANRFKEKYDGEGQTGILFYLGDHDPSGEDMVRDIRDRLAMFGVEELQVKKLALTMEQIEEHNPPPNPAKLTDPRSDAYVAEHGSSSWEVDALPPEVLTQIITDAFEEIIDQSMVDEIMEREEKHKAELKTTVEKLVKKIAKAEGDKS
jgi:hypothetical protein